MGSIPTATTMQIVEFYRGERPNHVGYTLDQIMGFSRYLFEIDHDYVQWLFPSNEPSQMNAEAPTLTREEAAIFCADPELKDKVKQSFIKMLDFYGFYLAQDDPIVIEALPSTELRPSPRLWLRRFNHNMLRVTRVLKCLRLVGLSEYATAFLGVLSQYGQNVSPNTFQYWTDAVSLPLWPDETKAL